MKHIRNSFSILFSTLLSAVQSLTVLPWKECVVAVACALIVFSNAAPALAFGSSSSKTSEGLEQLDKVQEKSARAISGERSAKNDTRAVMENSQKGLNGVQGEADKSKMTSPSDADSKTIEANVKDVLEKITP